MSVLTILRSATLALSLTAALGAMTGAFATAASAAPQQQQWHQQQSNTGPYDGPDFVIPLAQTYG